VPINDPLLSRSTRRSQYQRLVARRDRNAIADFFEERFTGRYIFPIENSTRKHGFATMAVSCLLIEAMDSFWRGTNKTEGKNRKAFIRFFHRSENLAVFRRRGAKFYQHVRCGILHQGESTGGWKVVRRGLLFDPATRTVNATAFHRALRQEIQNYADQLRRFKWNHRAWNRFRSKMTAICRNCL